jgi:uncharacterized protein (DUF1786 family)
MGQNELEEVTQAASVLTDRLMAVIQHRSKGLVPTEIVGALALCMSAVIMGGGFSTRQRRHLCKSAAEFVTTCMDKWEKEDAQKRARLVRGVKNL